jgi:hypothetical protein
MNSTNCGPEPVDFCQQLRYMEFPKHAFFVSMTFDVKTPNHLCVKQDLSNLEMSDLLDLLVLYTSRYTQQLTDGVFDIEFASYRELVLQLQSEIEARRMRKADIFN